MLGVTLAPTTGRALAELIVEGDSRIDLRPFTPRVQAA
jgi:glycine/D-amino acid oxidase-like deaminating enzyme